MSSECELQEVCRDPALNHRRSSSKSSLCSTNLSGQLVKLMLELDKMSLRLKVKIADIFPKA